MRVRPVVRDAVAHELVRVDAGRVDLSEQLGGPRDLLAAPGGRGKPDLLVRQLFQHLGSEVHREASPEAAAGMGGRSRLPNPSGSDFSRPAAQVNRVGDRYQSDPENQRATGAETVPKPGRFGASQPSCARGVPLRSPPRKEGNAMPMPGCPEPGLRHPSRPYANHSTKIS